MSGFPHKWYKCIQKKFVPTIFEGTNYIEAVVVPLKKCDENYSIIFRIDNIKAHK